VVASRVTWGGLLVGGLAPTWGSAAFPEDDRAAGAPSVGTFLAGGRFVGAFLDGALFASAFFAGAFFASAFFAGASLPGAFAGTGVVAGTGRAARFTGLALGTAFFAG
jgi:uncharacterized protein YjbI with pentapeptide repeats